MDNFNSLEVEVTLQRIKVSQPHMWFYLEAPKVEALTEEEKARNAAMDAAIKEFNLKLETILGKPPVKNPGGVQGWFWEDWMNSTSILKLALLWEEFKRAARYVTAEAYAMHLADEKIKAVEEYEKANKSQWKEPNAEPDKTS